MITDEILGQAAREYEEALLQKVSTLDKLQHTFSSRFLRKMKQLLWREAHPGAYRALQGAACAAVLFLVSTALLFSLNAQVRASVIGWLRESFSQHSEYHSQGNPAADAQSDYMLGQIPDGYTLLQVNTTSGSKNYVYVNESGQYLRFGYFYNSEDTTIFIDHLDHTYQKTTVNGYPADLYLAPDDTQSNGLIWEDPETHILFRIGGFFEEAELRQMAENIKKIKK